MGHDGQMRARARIVPRTRTRSVIGRGKIIHGWCDAVRDEPDFDDAFRRDEVLFPSQYGITVLVLISMRREAVVANLTSLRLSCAQTKVGCKHV